MGKYILGRTFILIVLKILNLNQDQSNLELQQDFFLHLKLKISWKDQDPFMNR